MGLGVRFGVRKWLSYLGDACRVLGLMPLLVLLVIGLTSQVLIVQRNTARPGPMGSLDLESVRLEVTAHGIGFTHLQSREWPAMHNLGESHRLNKAVIKKNFTRDMPTTPGWHLWRFDVRTQWSVYFRSAMRYGRLEAFEPQVASERAELLSPHPPLVAEFRSFCGTDRVSYGPFLNADTLSFSLPAGLVGLLAMLLAVPSVARLLGILYGVMRPFLPKFPSRRDRRARAGLCVNCGYDIKSLASCPECGTAFSRIAGEGAETRVQRVDGG